MPKFRNFEPVFTELKSILTRYASHLSVEADAPGSYSLNAAYAPEFKKEMFFGAVQIKKNYVSYYLMPLYVSPGLLEGMSPELKKRMQGKSCFNFTALDKHLVKELKQLTDKGFKLYEEKGWVYGRRYRTAASRVAEGSN